MRDYSPLVAIFVQVKQAAQQQVARESRTTHSQASSIPELGANFWEVADAIRLACYSMPSSSEPFDQSEADVQSEILRRVREAEGEITLAYNAQVATLLTNSSVWNVLRADADDQGEINARMRNVVGCFL